jgi:diguanylate cyclase (GGDEF)-like protein
MAILLPQTGQEGALHIAQRVHANLAERAIPFLDSPVAEHVTVSIGVASMLPGQSISAHTLVAHADEGLYAAKDNGRNRTEVIPRLRLIVSKNGESGHAVPGYLSEILNS